MARTSTNAIPAMAARARSPIFATMVLGLAALLLWAASFSTASAGQHPEGPAGPNDALVRCVIDILGFLPDGPDDLSPEQAQMVGQNCGGGQGGGGQRGAPAIDDETQRELKANFPEIFKKGMETPGSFVHQFDPRSAMSVSPEERLEQYERLWMKSGFAKWLSNFYDVMIPGEANEDYAEFFRNKIRERVNDPAIAELLCP